MREEEVERRHEFISTTDAYPLTVRVLCRHPPGPPLRHGPLESPPLTSASRASTVGSSQSPQGTSPALGRALQGLGRALGGAEEAEEMPQVDRLVESYLKGV